MSADCEMGLDGLFEKDENGIYWTRTRDGRAFPLLYCPLCGAPIGSWGKKDKDDKEE